MRHDLMNVKLTTMIIGADLLIGIGPVVLGEMGQGGVGWGEVQLAQDKTEQFWLG